MGRAYSTYVTEQSCIQTFGVTEPDGNWPCRTQA